MKAFEFRIPELNALPPERRVAVYRQCIESGAFSRRSRKIRIGTFIGAVLGFLVVNNAVLWSGVVKSDVLNALIAVGLLVLFIALMIFVQLWLYGRLTRNLIRNHIKSLSNPDLNLS